MISVVRSEMSVVLRRSQINGMPAGTVWPAMNGLHLYSFSTRVEPRSTACAGSSLAYELVFEKPTMA